MRAGLEHGANLELRDGEDDTNSKTVKLLLHADAAVDRTDICGASALMRSGFPHGRDGWISAAGSSWATMALALALSDLQIQMQLSSVQ